VTYADAKFLDQPHLPGLRRRPAVYGSVDALYEKTAMVGEGTYGYVRMRVGLCYC
jgi:hypothetical protein